MEPCKTLQCRDSLTRLQSTVDTAFHCKINTIRALMQHLLSNFKFWFPIVLDGNFKCSQAYQREKYFYLNVCGYDGGIQDRWPYVIWRQQAKQGRHKHVSFILCLLEENQTCNLYSKSILLNTYI